MAKITIKLSKVSGLGTIEYKGKVYKCGGMVGFQYPADSTIDPTLKGHKEELHISKEFTRPEYNHIVKMPYSILWIGQKGVYIHEWPNLELSHGCIHLLKGDAKEFYDSVTEKTRVVFEWV